MVRIGMVREVVIRRGRWYVCIVRRRWCAGGTPPLGNHARRVTESDEEEDASEEEGAKMGRRRMMMMNSERGGGRRCAYDVDCRAEDGRHLVVALSDGLHPLHRGAVKAVNATMCPVLYSPVQHDGAAAEEPRYDRDTTTLERECDEQKEEHHEESGREGGVSHLLSPWVQVAPRCVRYGAMDHRTFIAGYEDAVVRVFTCARATPELTIYLTAPSAAVDDVSVVAVRCSAVVRWLTYALDGSGVLYVMDLAHKQREVPLFAQSLSVGGGAVCVYGCAG